MGMTSSLLLRPPLVLVLLLARLLLLLLVPRLLPLSCGNCGNGLDRRRWSSEEADDDGDDDERASVGLSVKFDANGSARREATCTWLPYTKRLV